MVAKQLGSLCNTSLDLTEDRILFKPCFSCFSTVCLTQWYNFPFLICEGLSVKVAPFIPIDDLHTIL